MDWSDRSLRGQDFTRIAGAQAATADGQKAPGGAHRRSARKAASAKIAKIPFALSQWIARTYKPAARTMAPKG